jgi:hypothetical protein
VYAYPCFTIIIDICERLSGSSRHRSAGSTSLKWDRTIDQPRTKLERERMRVGRCYRPSVGLAEGLAMASVLVVMRNWRPGGSVDDGHGVDAAVSLPVAHSAPLIG